jgi:hypothetical protein
LHCHANWQIADYDRLAVGIMLASKGEQVTTKFGEAVEKAVSALCRYNKRLKSFVSTSGGTSDACAEIAGQGEKP